MTISQFHVLQGFMNGYRLNGYRLGQETLERMRDAPKFVFSHDVIQFINRHFDDYEDALNAAIRAGHSELPHDPMLVEWGDQTPDGMPCRLFWLVTGSAAHYRLSSGAIFYGKPAVYDGYLPIEVTEKAWLAKTFVGPVAPYDADDDEIRRSFKFRAGRALFYAMALHVRGIVTAPPRPVDPKLDRARLKRGQPPVTKDYVTVHIGYVTDRDGKRHDYQEGMGGHVRVHLRRGHTRNQACGRDRRDHKEVWIPSVLVNYRPGVTVSDANYLVMP